MKWDGKLDILLVGGGVIALEVILPTLFQEQREGKVGEISVCTSHARSIKKVRDVFLHNEFKPYPDPQKVIDENQPYPEEYKKAMDSLRKHSLVIVATPDHLHTSIVLSALERELDVIVEKPFCLKVSEAQKILEVSRKKGLYVYTDYHKRHDRSIRAAKYRYGKGDLGQILHGHAWIEEKKEVALKNIATWAEENSPFEYLGIHYADAYYFITGLKPKRLIGFAQKKFLPTQERDTYDSAQAVIEWEDGSVFWIQTSWILPQSTSSLTNQGLQLTGTKGEHKADHKDRHCYFVTDEGGFEHYNPNFFKAYNSWNHEGGIDWVGYGYESIVQAINDIRDIHYKIEGLPPKKALKKRREIICRLERIRPLPNQALIGIAIIEAVRMSFGNDSRYVYFDENMNLRME